MKGFGLSILHVTYDQGSRIHTEFAPLELYYAPGLGLTYGGGWSDGLPTDRFIIVMTRNMINVLNLPIGHQLQIFQKNMMH